MGEIGDVVKTLKLIVDSQAEDVVSVVRRFADPVVRQRLLEYVKQHVLLIDDEAIRNQFLNLTVAECSPESELTGDLLVNG